MTETNNSVCLLKMINGDELIAQYKTDIDDNIVVSEPLVVEETNYGGSATIVLTTYLPFSKTDTVSFKKMHVITITGVTDAVSRFYFNSLISSKSQIIDKIDKQLNFINATLESQKANEHLLSTNTNVIPDNIFRRIRAGSDSIN